MVSLHQDHEEADVDIRSIHGSLTAQMADYNNNFSESVSIDSHQKKTVKYEDKEEKKSENDIVIFKEVKVRVKSKEDCLFSLRVTPKNKFKLMRVNMIEMVHPTSLED